MKKTLFVEYTAPEMEVISTIVEAGFEGSISLASLEEENYGTY